MRYERKYRIESFSPEVVKQVVFNHPASFRTLYPDRQINNIYFDTSLFTAYRENVDGVAQRRKYRVRWYGEEMEKIVDPKVEIKIKNNLLGDKEIYPVSSDFTLHDLTALSEEVSRRTIYSNILQPTLINSYQRSYFGTSGGKFRLTVDWNLRYFSLLTAYEFTNYQHEDPAVVVEVKYDEKWEEEADYVLQYLPFRFSKSSKYVTGMQLGTL